MTRTDSLVEQATRWIATRASRRSFLGRGARVAMLVAGGPVLAGFLTEGRAEARVCGQSGVSPKCPTYDCVGPDRVWGWCWYANGGACCAGGGLKKICDCCVTNWPNVHGYCPSGTNVMCIVESCWADPRVQTVPLARVGDGSPVATALDVSRRRFANGSAPAAVVGDADDALAASVAGAAAGATARPLLLVARAGLAPAVVDELRRLGATSVTTVGPGLPASVDGYLRALGLTVERVGAPGADLGASSVDVARWVQQRTATDRAFLVAPGGVSAAAAPSIAAAAGAVRAPLLVGGAAAQALSAARTYLAGPEAIAEAGSVAGGYPLDATDAAALARIAGNAATLVENRTAIAAGAAPIGTAAAVGLAGIGGVVVLHPGGALDDANAQWLRDHQSQLARGWCAGGAGTLGDKGYYDLQSALNHFDAHRLIGVSGQGLPVISQPLAEREIGRARLTGTPARDLNAGYWVGRANPDR
ncbi:MAG TPA: hypothetical protein VFK42_04100 [Acidimicrobiales bacterium]|nr:hypothetical protein [Acidimicrobiales bacterium]